MVTNKQSLMECKVHRTIEKSMTICTSSIFPKPFKICIRYCSSGTAETDVTFPDNQLNITMLPSRDQTLPNSFFNFVFFQSSYHYLTQYMLYLFVYLLLLMHLEYKFHECRDFLFYLFIILSLLP